MASSYEKSVKGGTKIKLAAPKSKYVEHILQATDTGDAGVAEIFRTMQFRLRDSTWTIVFKALIITHLMIREGKPNLTLRYLSESPSKLAISNFSEVQVQGENIRHYYAYLQQRVRAYHDTRIDWVRDSKGRLKKQTIDKGLLRETEIVQKQIQALLKCEFFAQEAENEITLTAFRLLTMDLLSLYHIGNEGTINVLERYFEMSKPDAERALEIYKTFTKQTDRVVSFLSVARQYENATRLEIPKLKHAPTGLTGALEEYLNDPDFEINRRQYLAQKEGKQGGKASSSTKEATSDFSKLSLNGSSSKPEAQSSQAPAAMSQPKGPAPDLIDFFESIERNQQPMGSQPQPPFTGLQTSPQSQFQQQSFQSPQAQAPQLPNQSFGGTNPFASMVAQSQPQNPSQPAFTGFGGQPQTQNTQFSPTQNLSPNQTSPFQQQPFPTGQPQAFPNGAQQQPQQQQFVNGSQPFNQSQPPQQFGQSQTQQPFPQGQTQQPFPQSQNQGQTQQPFPQSQTQPFSPQSTASSLQPFATGQQSTNPFRQSMMPQPTASTVQSFATGSPTSVQSQQSTNPFRSFSPQTVQNGSSPFAASAPASSTSSFFSAQSLQSPQSVQSMPTAQPLQTARTGTNPFKSAPPSTFQTPTTSPLVPQKTGTNPFRQSAFVNQQTGQGWQASQGTIGGLTNIETIPVFPRPAGQ